MLFKSEPYELKKQKYYDEIQLFENGMAHCKTYQIRSNIHFIYYGHWKRYGERQALILFDNKDQNYRDAEIGFFCVNLNETKTGDYTKLEAVQIKALVGIVAVTD